MTTTIDIIFDAGLTGSAAALAAFPVESADQAMMTKTTTDWQFSGLTAFGYAGSAIPADGASLPAGGLVNVGVDSPKALTDNAPSIVGAASAVVVNGTAPKVRIDSNGRGGIDFTGSSSLEVHKAGIANNNVGNPVAESFLDFVVTGWVKLTTAVGASPFGVFGCGTNGSQKMWGFYLNNSDQSIREALSGAILAIIGTNTWYQIAAHYSFNTTSGAITLRLFLNGTEVGAAQVVSTTISTMTGWSTSATRTQIGAIMAFGPWTGVITEPHRVFTAIPGHVIDPAAFVAAEYAANKSLVAGL